MSVHKLPKHGERQFSITKWSKKEDVNAIYTFAQMYYKYERNDSIFIINVHVQLFVYLY